MKSLASNLKAIVLTPLHPHSGFVAARGSRWPKAIRRWGLGTLSLLCTLSAVHLASPAAAQVYQDGQYIREGEIVRLVQQRLQAVGYDPGVVDGVYGELTRTAVLRFQRANSIFADGVVGPETLSALGLTSSGVPTVPGDIADGDELLEPGDRGPRVAELQEELRDAGFYSGPIDGIYGIATQRAVESFQRSQGLFVDGIAGEETLGALGLGAPYVVVIPGDEAVLLSRVRQTVPSAYVDDRSVRGPFVNAGAFRDRDPAERRTDVLRDLGFDARVEYF